MIGTREQYCQLIERLKCSNELWECPNNFPPYYTTKPILEEIGLTHEILKADLPDAAYKGQHNEVYLFDIEALVAWYNQPTTEVDWPAILGYHRRIGRG